MTRHRGSKRPSALGFVVIIALVPGGCIDAEKGATPDLPSMDAAHDRTDLLASDGGPDGPDATGCACTKDDGFGPGAPASGVTSLACFCAHGGCPTDYDPAPLGCCYSGSAGVVRYDDCGLVVVGRSCGLGGESYVFDANTHELVGASRRTDTSDPMCGASAFVVNLRAGRFPAANCAMSEQRTVCSRVDSGSDADSVLDPRFDSDADSAFDHRPEASPDNDANLE